jgi:cytosol alanyl aminopeptidase
LLAACAHPVPPPASPAAPGRLDPRIVPRFNDLTLRVTDAKGFSGTIAIDLDVGAPTRELVLHAAPTLRILEAKIGTVQARHRRRGDLLTLDAGALLEGPVHVELRFEGTYGKTRGLMFSKGVLSMFEPIHAREAFPCFDEPSFKAPWRVSLRVPDGHVAVSNAPVEGERRHEDGTRTVRFQVTAPLPSYLIAVASGPYHVHAFAGNHPLRIFLPDDAGDHPEWIAALADECLGELEAFFGERYPYEKLDLILTDVVDGEEHPGLVYMHRANFQLDRLSWASDGEWARFVLLHELAHMWFGNLVTPASWDDLWLKEGLATWVTQRIMGTVVDRRQKAILLEGRSPGRVRVAVKNGKPGLEESYARAYEKAALVFHTLESFLGEGRFRAGLERYLAGRRHGMASTDDFLDDVAGGAAVADAVRGLIDTPGVPVLRARLTCQEGRGTVELLEETDTHWKVPACVRTGAEGWERRVCAVVDEVASVPLDRCADWVVPDDNGGRFHRWAGTEHVDAALVADALSLYLEHKLAAVELVSVLVRAARLDDYEVDLAVLQAVAVLREEVFAEGWPALLDALYADRLDWKVVPGESVFATYVRRELVAALTNRDGPSTVRAEAARQLRALLVAAEPDPELLELLTHVRWANDHALFVELQSAMDRHPGRGWRDALNIMRALSPMPPPRPRDEELTRALSGWARE